MNKLLQEVANGVAAGSYIAILAVGYSLIFGTTRQFHFAHGSVFMVAGWMLLLSTKSWQLGYVVGIPLMIAVAIVMGVLIDRVFYRPLYAREDAAVGVILTGLGLFFVFENVVAIIQGSVVDFPPNPLPGVVTIGGVLLSKLQLAGVLALPLVWASMLFVLRRTRLGRAIRAAGSDPLLSYTVGIDVPRVRLWVFGIGSALAAVAALIVTADYGFTPPMGLQAILLATVAVIVGGIGSITGAAIAGIVLGLAQHISVMGISSEWQNPIAFGVLMIAILMRPTGLGGRT